jgi:uncharacterized protein
VGSSRDTSARVVVRLYGDLADFVPAARRTGALAVSLRGRVAVKDVLESAGVPHPEIDVVLVDGEAVGFDRVVAGGERIAAFPRFRSLDLGETRRAGPAEAPPARFVLDVHLGRLARLLRLAGFDADLDPARDDAEIVRSACASGRTILTRDVGLLKRGAVRHGAFVRSEEPLRQFVEVGRRFGLRALAAPFTRCLVCNGRLVAVPREDAEPLVPDGIASRHDAFVTCGRCRRVYWAGSHHARLAEKLERWLAAT